MADLLFEFAATMALGALLGAMAVYSLLRLTTPPKSADKSRLEFRFENRELGADLGVRLNPERHYESWSIYGDFSDTSYQSPNSTNKTTFQLISIGVRKQF